MRKNIKQFKEYTAGRGGWCEWNSPKMKGYKMQCCDCGLIHEIDFKVVKFKGKPDENGLSACKDIKDKDIQVIWRLRRAK